MKLQLRLLSWYRIFFLPELHDDLHTMPVVLWWKIEKEGNAIDLIKRTKTSSDKIINYVNKQKEKLNDDFTDFFGIQEKQQKRLKLIAKHQYCVAMYAVTKSHIWTTRRLYVEIELEAYKPTGGAQINQYEELRNVSMSLDGANMNPQTMSVFQYYSDRGMAIKRNNKAKQDAKRLKGK